MCVFNSRKQQEAEPLDCFRNILKKLVKSCEYNDQIDSILADRIDVGIRDGTLQETLIAIEKIALEKSAKLC